MSTVKRSIYLNPIEPAPLSLRAAGGMETRIELNYFSQNGTAYDRDVAAQLQLTGRSSARTTTYSVPSTDIANGKARAVIPAGDLTDINGYRLRLVGTVNQESALIALGLLRLVEAAGIEAVLEDVIDTVDITMTRAFPMLMTVKLWHDASKTNPYDASSGITAAVYESQAGVQLVPFTIAQLGYNEVQLSLTDLQVNALPDRCWWSLTAATAAGTTTLVQGNVSVTGVAPP